MTYEQEEAFMSILIIAGIASLFGGVWALFGAGTAFVVLGALLIVLAFLGR